MNITSGVIPGAKKVVIYGPEGIGKSTMASQFPDPVFIDTEGSTKSMDVKRFDAPKKWEDVFEAVKYVISDPKCCKSLICDTADWAEMFCINYTCQKGGVNGIEDFGYGKGYVYLAENFKKLLDLFDRVIELGINVVVTAHAKMRKFEQPDEMGAYDRWEMKLSKQVAPMIKEWADIVLFANYKTYVVEDDKTKSKKAQGGKRVMYATHNPCWDAKNRFGLADCLAFDYSEIKKVIEGMPEKTTSKKPENSGKKAEKPAEKPVEKPVEKTAAQKLKDKIVESALDEVMVRRAIAKKGAYPEETPIDDYDVSFIDNSILAKWESFKKYVEKLYAELDEVPFK
ncbi:MAG: ATP-binding protein [Clostridiales bacterium]|nr:ATP-binding protein [Clostridiales bacterium]